MKNERPDTGLEKEKREKLKNEKKRNRDEREMRQVIRSEK